jgi:hypothetical protein
MKDVELRPVFVERMPKVLEQGVLYVSEEYELAIHLCACGECKIQTVTPFKDFPNDRGWTYTRSAEDKITLHPSIGNQQFPCHSHYWVQENKIVWC